MIKKKFYLIILFVFLFIPVVLALCEKDQIDINSASKEELDNLYGIGPVKAEAIIDSRPFKSVDELIKVYGIGEITLNKIKEQGLACVSEETEEAEEVNKDIIKNNSYQEELLAVESNFTESLEKLVENTEPEVIRLNPKDIKSENNKENLDKSNYAIYGFVVFCVLLCLLFILKKNKYTQNEFK